MARELKLEDYKSFYENFHSKPQYAKAYLTVYNKFVEICEEFEKVKIDITDEESALFKNYLAFSKQAKTILSDLDEMMAKIDKDRAVEIKQEQRKVGEASLENMIQKFSK